LRALAGTRPLPAGKFLFVYEPIESEQQAAARGVCQAPKVLCLGGTHNARSH
jgi:hypothetical protein